VVRSLSSLNDEQARALADERDTRSRGDNKRSRAVVEELLARLASELIELAEGRLHELGLPEPVLDVVADARAMKVGAARNRQLRLVRRELRECDWFSIRTRVQQLKLHGTAPAGNEPLLTGSRPKPEAAWTVRLLSEGDYALDAFLEEQPSAERNHLRTLLREARKAAPERRGKAEQRLTAAVAAILRPRPGASAR
jgi:ribosome-associated protein